VVGRGARRYRLTGVGAFEGLFRTGRRCEGTWLQIVAVPAQAGPGRVGYVIGKKALPHAVDRNRVRRVLREELRRARPGIEDFDVIVRLKRACARHEVPAVAAEAAMLLNALIERDRQALVR
jgi:ribonuclease P protein component